jgi:uncharacterized protein YdeI (YjbR/CyaY-like superfamily)
MNEVDEFLANEKKWQLELRKLRAIALDCMLVENFKWKHPCYTDKNKNIVIIHGFKDYCALLFFKGVFLRDELNLLIQQTENVQEGRQIRFKNLKEIEDLEPVLKAYILEAVEVERRGLRIDFKNSRRPDYPDEFIEKLQEFPALRTAFEALTPGRQKEYIFYFKSAKQVKTRESRIENSMKRIFDKKGLNDCTCGLSKRMPSCDGSHKLLKKEI